MIHLELTLPPIWDRVREARAALIHAARAVGLGDEYADIAGLVTSELLENAIKYGNFSLDGPAVTLVVHMSSGLARIVVTNPVDPRSEHPQRLRATLARLADAASPLDAYVARMAQILTPLVPHRPSQPPEPDSTESGLGILRVAHEGGSTVNARFLGEAAIEVTASMSWSPDDLGELVA